MKNGLLRIQSDSDSAGRGRKRNKEAGGARRKERRGGRSDEESEKMEIYEKMKKEKVAEGRIVDPRGLVSSIFFHRRKVYPTNGRLLDVILPH